jgi:cytochrome c oxidase subunit III
VTDHAPLTTVDGTGAEVPALRTRPFLDVGDLPDVAFGTRDLLWWGTLGFVVIEGFTLALCAMVYLYLWKNFNEWPPAGTERPTLFWPGVQIVLMLAILPVAWSTKKAAERFDFGHARLGQTVLAVGGVAMTGVRLLELGALHAKWSMNAYASAAWLVVAMHATLLAVNLVESVGIALLFWVAPVEKKHFSDVADDAFYSLFLVLVWFPLFLMVYVGPWVAS